MLLAVWFISAALPFASLVTCVAIPRVHVVRQGEKKMLGFLPLYQIEGRGAEATHTLAFPVYFDKGFVNEYAMPLVHEELPVIKPRNNFEISHKRQIQDLQNSNHHPRFSPINYHHLQDGLVPTDISRDHILGEYHSNILELHPKISNSQQPSRDENGYAANTQSSLNRPHYGFETVKSFAPFNVNPLEHTHPRITENPSPTPVSFNTLASITDPSRHIHNTIDHAYNPEDNTQQVLERFLNPLDINHNSLNPTHNSLENTPSYHAHNQLDHNRLDHVHLPLEHAQNPLIHAHKPINHAHPPIDHAHKSLNHVHSPIENTHNPFIHNVPIKTRNADGGSAELTNVGGTITHRQVNVELDQRIHEESPGMVANHHNHHHHNHHRDDQHHHNHHHGNHRQNHHHNHQDNLLHNRDQGHHQHYDNRHSFDQSKFTHAKPYINHHINDYRVYPDGQTSLSPHLQHNSPNTFANYLHPPSYSNAMGLREYSANSVAGHDMFLGHIRNVVNPNPNGSDIRNTLDLKSIASQPLSGRGSINEPHSIEGFNLNSPPIRSYNIHSFNTQGNYNIHPQHPGHHTIDINYVDLNPYFRIRSVSPPSLVYPNGERNLVDTISEGSQVIEDLSRAVNSPPEARQDVDGESYVSEHSVSRISVDERYQDGGLAKPVGKQSPPGIVDAKDLSITTTSHTNSSRESTRIDDSGPSEMEYHVGGVVDEIQVSTSAIQTYVDNGSDGERTDGEIDLEEPINGDVSKIKNFKDAIYNGSFEGYSCTGKANGLYYIGEISFIYCSNGVKYHQQCAAGSANHPRERFHLGTSYSSRDLCSVNTLV